MLVISSVRFERFVNNWRAAKVLLVISEGKITAKRTAQRTGLLHRTVNRWVHDLEESGLVKRSAAMGDEGLTVYIEPLRPRVWKDSLVPAAKRMLARHGATPGGRGPRRARKS